MITDPVIFITDKNSSKCLGFCNNFKNFPFAIIIAGSVFPINVSGATGDVVIASDIFVVRRVTVLRGQGSGEGETNNCGSTPISV